MKTRTSAKPKRGVLNPKDYLFWINTGCIPTIYFFTQVVGTGVVMRIMESLVILAILTVQSFGEFRVWTDKNGNSFEGELITEMGEQVCLKSKSGKILKVPKSGLSPKDVSYINTNRKPKLALDLGKIKKKLDQYSYYYHDRLYYLYDLRAKVKIKNRSMYEPGLPLSVHVFFFSKSDELVRHEHAEEISFNARNKTFEFETAAMRFYEGGSTADEARVYGGYMIMVIDSKNRIVDVKCTNEKAEDKQDKLLAYAISKVKKDSQLKFRELQPYSAASRL